MFFVKFIYVTHTDCSHPPPSLISFPLISTAPLYYKSFFVVVKIYVFLFLCVFPACMSVKLPDSLELELQTVVSCYVGDENWTRALKKGTQ